jgi:hypothetical protein
MVENKVLIGVITQNFVPRPDFYDYLSLMKRPENSLEVKCHDRSPAKGRNLVIQAAIENKCSHLLFVDDDMAMKEDALFQLLEHDKDIVSGLYLIGSYPHQPVIFDVADETTGACLYCYLDGNEPRLKPIVCAGFGFVLIKMDVFSRLEKPYVRLGELDPEHWCDDVGFFNRVRKVGIQSYCDMECRVGHMKTMIIWPDKVDGKWFSSYDTNGIGMAINVPQAVPDEVFAMDDSDA